MASSLPVEPKVPSQLNKCANCKLFGWEQPEQGVRLLQCTKCKVLQYCSKACQVEHWMLVHKEHCKELAQAKKLEEEGKVSSRVPVGIYSHHPFPKEGLREDTLETLVFQAHRILIKMRLACLSGYASSEMHDDLLFFEKYMEANRHAIWAERKIRPRHDTTFGLKLSQRLESILEKYSIPAEDMICEDLWSTFNLVWGRLYDQNVMRWLNNLKEPHDAVPLKIWDGLEDEIGLFPTRVQELIDAVSSTQVPSFKELLRIYCGGNLEQNCTFCGITMTVVAVTREVEGWRTDVPTVCLHPFLPLLFHCGEDTCERDFSEKLNAWDDLSAAVNMLHNKLAFNKCDFCFKLSENVYR